jgi:hypothetical protein
MSPGADTNSERELETRLHFPPLSDAQLACGHDARVLRGLRPPRRR